MGGKKDDSGAVRIRRRKAVPMSEIVDSYIRSMRIAAGLNTQLVYRLWDEVTGAGQFTLRKFYRGGTLYVTLSSSVVRRELYFQKETILEKINARLAEDPLFTEDNRSAGYVREIVMK